MGQQIAEGDDQTEVTLQLVRAVPLEGKLVILDADLFRCEVVNTIVAQGEDYLGPIRGNEVQVKKATDEWIEAKIPLQADLIRDRKRHNRIERCDLWIVNAAELKIYI